MATYEELSRKYHELESEDPIALVCQEDFSKVDELGDNSREAVERDAAKNIALADEIRDSKYPGENIDEKLDMMLAENLLRGGALDDMALIGNTPCYALQPSALYTILQMTPDYIERDPRDKSKIVDGFILRFNQLGKYLENELKCLDRPNKIWVKLELMVAEGFDESAKAVWDFAKSVGYKNMTTLDAAIDKAREITRIYMTALSIIPKRRNMSFGHETAQRFFDHVCIPMTLTEMYVLALNNLVEQNEIMSRLKPEIIKKYDLVGNPSNLEVSDFLKNRFATEKGKIRKKMRDEFEKAKRFAYEKGLVAPLTNESSRIERPPKYLEPSITTAAVFTPGSFCKGIRKSLCYVKDSEGDSEIEKEMNRLAIPWFVSHELIPGHHYQISRSNEHPSLVRAWSDPNCLAEGWTTYVAEDVMEEMGYARNPEFAKEKQFIDAVDKIRLSPRVMYTLAWMTGDRSYLTNSFVEAENPDLHEACIELFMKISGYPENMARYDFEDFT
ncbi:DUF885 domain-containing protein, partial [Candidatus Woesearchaeota archaeon]|nr:DUF885 domain-containing protein [Candidatus Woesearchaeota archaeon]